MKQETINHIKMELQIITELTKQGTIDNYTCGDISKMAEERGKE